MVGPRIVSMLPARNAAADLPGHLESVARFADAVVALDDGSTDDTRAILEAHPLVRTVLTNPPRETYVGWDDAANRSRLLEAALALEPGWVMSLDADELLAADDAAALRAFLGGPADPDCVYSFRVFRMIEDLEHYDQDHLWVARCFSPRPEHSLPSALLHFAPVPTAIPPDRWHRTTIRIQHRSSLTAERRRARYEKYRQADPEVEWQWTYEHLLDEPGAVRRWVPRSPHLPVLVNDAVVDERPLAPDEPAISVVVIARDDEAVIGRAVGAVVAQELDDPFEVIVVTSGGDRTAAVVREQFPGVIVVELDHPALPGEARNAGLRLARGRYVTFPGSHVELAPGSLAARLDAHRRGWALVTETMLNGTGTWSGWATYFLDNSSVLPGRPSFVLRNPPIRCSYPRDALLEVGGFPEDMRTAEDSVVNEELFRRGFGAYHERDVVVVHHSPCATPGRLLVHHFRRGRGRGRIVAAKRPDPGMPPSFRPILKYALLSVPGRLLHTHEAVREWGAGLRRYYYRSLPLLACAVLASWVGGNLEIARRRLRRPRRR